MLPTTSSALLGPIPRAIALRPAMQRLMRHRYPALCAGWRTDQTDDRAEDPLATPSLPTGPPAGGLPPRPADRARRPQGDRAEGRQSGRARGDLRMLEQKVGTGQGCDVAQHFYPGPLYKIKDAGFDPTGARPST